MNFSRIGIFTRINRHNIHISGTRYIQIGNFVHVEKNARIEAITQYAGVKYNPHIIIGDNVLINQNFHCTCGELLIIGDGTSITANCGIFDIIHPYEDITINPKAQKIKTLPVKIGKNCMIGMNSVIMPGVNMGNHVIVGCNSTVVKGEYPSYCVLAGSPARIVKTYCKENDSWI